MVAFVGNGLEKVFEFKIHEEVVKKTEHPQVNAYLFHSPPSN